MSRVKPHTRRVKGKTVKVKQHSRKPNPRKAGNRAMRGYRAARKRQYSKAAALGVGAVGTFGAWATLQGSAIGLTALGLAIVGLGALARRGVK